jgi:hypothetical protein
MSSKYKKFLDLGMLTSRYVAANFDNLGQKRSVLMSIFLCQDKIPISKQNISLKNYLETTSFLSKIKKYK